jgi:hypothetical protein
MARSSQGCCAFPAAYDISPREHRIRKWEVTMAENKFWSVGGGLS